MIEAVVYRNKHRDINGINATTKICLTLSNTFETPSIKIILIFAITPLPVAYGLGNLPIAKSVKLKSIPINQKA